MMKMKLKDAKNTSTSILTRKRSFNTNFLKNSAAGAYKTFPSPRPAKPGHPDPFLYPPVCAVLTVPEGEPRRSEHRHDQHTQPEK